MDRFIGPVLIAIGLLISLYAVTFMVSPYTEVEIDGEVEHEGTDYDELTPKEQELFDEAIEDDSGEGYGIHFGDVSAVSRQDTTYGITVERTTMPTQKGTQVGGVGLLVTFAGASYLAFRD